jgi:GNAT superfamily N-acetyltransferase
MLHAGTISSVDIHRADPSGADSDLLPAAAILAAAEGEREGGLTPLPADLALARLRAPTPHGERFLLIAGDLASPSGVVVVEVENGPVNAHIAQLTIAVAPEHRCTGVGRTLVAHAAEVVAASGRTLLITTSESFVPAGAAFASAVGFEPGLVMRINRLELAGLDWSLVDAWVTDPDPEYELVRVDGRMSDDIVPAFLTGLVAMNDAPVDSLDVEDEQPTIEDVRAMEARADATNARSLILVARHKATGEGAGFTGVRAWPHTPSVLWQGGTATTRDHRGHGLGRWMKAEMLRWVRDVLPDVTEVRTENAHTNPHMLAINDALGFVAFAEQTIHQRRLG